MPTTFNPQVGATTGAKIGTGGQSERIKAGASSHIALRGAQLRESRSQYEKMMAQNKEQFNVAQGVQKDQFNRQMAMAKKDQKYRKGQDEKAERTARIGTSISVGKMGLDMANEFDVNLADNLGFGDGAADGVDGDMGGGSKAAVGGGKLDQINPAAYGENQQGSWADAQSSVGGEDGMADAGGDAGGGTQGSFWSDHGQTISGGVMGGVMGGLMGSNISQAIFGEGKTQGAAGGALGGGVSGYAATGTWQGGAIGAVLGGALGYLL